MNAPTLSKSSFGSGLQCVKRLWIEKRNRALLPAVSSSQQAVFDQGHEIGNWSHRLYPDGFLLEGELDFQTHLRASREALSLRRPLFEPAFSISGAYARVDILVPIEADQWDLLEVKSSSNIWDKARSRPSCSKTLLFSFMVYRSAGVNIRRAYLVFLNRDYIREGEVDPQRLFRREDVTRRVEVLLPGIPAQISQLLKGLEASEEPPMALGPHCFAPYNCSLVSYCWKDVPENSVFTLVRGGARAWSWWRNGTRCVADLPVDEKYSPAQSIQIKAERTGEMQVDLPQIQSFLEGLHYPLHFLDFETTMPAVPLFDGTRPYNQIPFQFSLHVQAEPEGPLLHHGFLADGPGDPRPGFLLALQGCLGTEGSIVSYNSAFETTCLKAMAVSFPLFAAWIATILPRFADADLLAPFRSFAAYHPDQHGSASIKSVLPAFTDLSYDDLTIQEGGSASNEFLRLLKGLVPAKEIPELRENLLRYCERDTLAMVRLVEKLQLLAERKPALESVAEAPVEPITRLRVDELLRFLPLLDKTDQKLNPKWQEPPDLSGNEDSFPMPLAIYPTIVNDFFKLASQPCWSDYGYDMEAAAKMLQNDETIATSSLSEIKTMLIFCVRGERFCDGHWGEMIRAGKIEAILRRLAHLRETIG